MLYCNKIDASKEIDLSKMKNSKKCMIWYQWFFNHGFESQDYTCNGCHNMAILSVNKSDIDIIIVKHFVYCCIIHNISKSEAINLLKNSVCGYVYRQIDR